MNDREEITYRGKKLSDCSREELIKAVERLFSEKQMHIKDRQFLGELQRQFEYKELSITTQITLSDKDVELLK